jgi:hypothetical protein
MPGPLTRLYDQVSDRWTSWLAVRRCIRLARADLTEFDPLNSQAIASPEPFGCLSTGEISGHKGLRLVPDDELALAIAELSLEHRLVLDLFKQGATYREIAAALRLSDEHALHELKTVLCRLADQFVPPAADTDGSTANCGDDPVR